MTKDSEIEEIDRDPPISVFLSGESFFHSAKYLREGLEDKSLRIRFQMPVYYLYSHAFELTLKAFLRVKGHSSDDVRKKFGHKLQLVWTACLNEGLKLNPVAQAFVEQIVDLLDPYATEYEFRYVKTGFKSLPSLEDIESSLNDLLETVRPLCEATVGTPIAQRG